MPRSFLVKSAREESLPNTARSGAQSEIASLIGRKLRYGIERCECELSVQPANENLTVALLTADGNLGTSNSSASVNELDVLHKENANYVKGVLQKSDVELEMTTADTMSSTTGQPMDIHVPETLEPHGRDRLSLAISQRYNGLKIPLPVTTNGYLENSHTGNTDKEREKINREIAREIVDLQTERLRLYKEDQRVMEDVHIRHRPDSESSTVNRNSPSQESIRNSPTDINGNKVENRHARTSQRNNVDDENHVDVVEERIDGKTDDAANIEYITDDETDVSTRSPGHGTVDKDRTELLSDRKTVIDGRRPLVSAGRSKSPEYSPWHRSLYPGYPPSYPYYPYCFPGLPFPIMPEHFPFRHSAEQNAYAAHRALYPSLPFPPNIPPYGLPPKTDKLFSLENRKEISQFKSAFDPVNLTRENSPSPVQRRMDRSETEILTQENKKDPDPSKYQCSGCQKGYSTFSGLSKHKQFHCSNDIKKEFNCKYCEKTYVSLGALKMHIRTHTLPCKCKICGKAFSRPWLLQGHVRTHTGEKPFSCNQCSRAFADRSNLRAHLQTHSDVKKYSCKRCSKTFSRMSLLLKHEDSCGFGYSA